MCDAETHWHTLSVLWFNAGLRQLVSWPRFNSVGIESSRSGFPPDGACALGIPCHMHNKAATNQNSINMGTWLVLRRFLAVRFGLDNSLTT